MTPLNISSNELVDALLAVSQHQNICILDSCGVGHLGSHHLIAGVEPVSILEITKDDPSETFKLLDKKLSGDLAAIFTISYDFGRKLVALKSPEKEFANSSEPDVYVALFDSLIVHDYSSGETNLIGNDRKFDSVREILAQTLATRKSLREVMAPIGSYQDDEAHNQLPAARALASGGLLQAKSNFTKTEYLTAIESIKTRIRDGDTYQTNLTQQLEARLPDGVTPDVVFDRLRRDHPAPFAAFIKRLDSTIVSASPERFFSVRSPDVSKDNPRIISTSPIKGTRQRGRTEQEDALHRRELLNSAKDRAENTMIVDLLRNDLGRVCEFGSVDVEKLCDLEEHPTLFHLVSTINGELRDEVKFSDILNAVFPCGSITGAPKISTMKIIDEIETANRGLSMGAIGYCVPTTWDSRLATCDLSVAIRTMVIRDKVATFNVGGGITIDSDPDTEYEETLLKAKALLKALGHAGTI